MMNERRYVTPGEMDVLCGRGTTLFKHPGNQALRTKIALNVQKYGSCSSRKGKTVVIHEIILSVMKDGGRFLQYDKSENKWFDGGVDAAKSRVGSAFRDASAGKVKCIEELKESMDRKRSFSRSATSPKRSFSRSASPPAHTFWSQPTSNEKSQAVACASADAQPDSPLSFREAASYHSSLMDFYAPSDCFEPTPIASAREDGPLEASSANSLLEVLSDACGEDSWSEAEHRQSSGNLSLHDSSDEIIEFLYRASRNP